MSIQPLRGFRDFYPIDQAAVNYLQTKIADTCRLFGYENFEGPSLEPFELYAAKSSDEIVNEQAFVFTDRGDEKITLRPELTPTLARMITNKQRELVYPLRWWSFGRFWRYERPQKGRGREFYQWNCDIIGDDSIQAEAEMIQIIVRFLQSLGLNKSDCVIEVSDRSFVNSFLTEQGIEANKIPAVFRFLDKLPKLTKEDAASFATDLGLSPNETTIINQLADATTSIWQQSESLNSLMNTLKHLGLADWVQPNLSLVRGFTYYTGIVFEVSDRAKAFRALLGGGRYSNLVEAMGGEPLSGVGFGMGDMVILEYLDSKNLLPAYQPQITACVITIGDNNVDYSQSVADTLRQGKYATLFYGATQNLGRGLKYAGQKGAQCAVIIGDNEVQQNQVTVKDLTTGEQTTVDKDTILSSIKKTSAEPRGTS